MLKPNYGLLPTILLVHRMFVQKRMTIACDPDFLALAITTTLYLVLIWFFFYDYIAVIFTDVMEHYTRLTQIGFLVRAACWGLAYIIGMLVTIRVAKLLPDGKRRLIFLLIFGALANLIPYISMMRGFSYHILPSLICFIPGIGLLSYLLLRGRLSSSIAAMIVFAALSLAGYGVHAVPQVANRQVIKNLPVTQLVRGCGPDCRFWLISPSLPMTQLTAFYAERDSASRFPSLWFLKSMNRLKQGNPEKYQEYAAKYTAMIISDLREYAPDLIIICVNPKSIDFLYTDQDFSREWDRYYPDGSVRIDYRDYYFKNRPRDAGPMDCPVYRRVGDAQRV